MTGSSWVDIEAIMNFEVSDTTLRARRDEWIDAGVFDQLEAEARAAYDRIIELDLDVVAIDGSLHKAPCGGEGTGQSPVDRAKLGWKWSVAAERARDPDRLVDRRRQPQRRRHARPHPGRHRRRPGCSPTSARCTLDRSYDYPARSAHRLHARGLTDLDIQRRGTKPPPGAPHRLTLGLRWVVEATNTWWSNYGQLRRSTDRKTRHRHAALQLATAVLIVGRLIDYRNRWSPA